ncbi:DUF7681 family protein [Actinosynnema mirum]|uniref:Acb2/Tad1 hairpin domain-containing protein n=1 Tax=Actinosynnema mirum (strain ATCC 29888 / DSM 43827 / JCM 3225 / NBRC 14064 / NCIMB 13271 / NRRL B-12336 / IMRU 3971 / 101) TaxID=446462 RepID=C6WC73_ACTMD|nr:hypothetical protein [Actinosynnema mirum]ACU39461.1 conserved hypothetical protein [Actinosynnema mirum DSM 43827]
MENQHQKITGYRDLDQNEIDVMNAVKEVEKEFAALWRRLGNLPDVDRRWLAVARTHVEEGCSAAARAVARPDSPFDA